MALTLTESVSLACEDGAIHVWAANSNFARPNAVRMLHSMDVPLLHEDADFADTPTFQSAENAHTKGSTISGLAFSPDGTQLVSRSSDGTVKRKAPGESRSVCRNPR